jgi:hypothetical protein
LAETTKRVVGPNAREIGMLRRLGAVDAAKAKPDLLPKTP